MVYFDKQQLRLIQQYFEQMDTDKNGYIGVPEIEETLLSLGLS